MMYLFYTRCLWEYMRDGGGGGVSSSFHFLGGVGGVPPPKKIVINLPGTYEKLAC